MNAKPLYEEDFHAWALEQARILRTLRPGAPLPNALDLRHVAEEVEDLGNEQRFQAEGNLTQAWTHLIKIALRPDDMAVDQWIKETVALLRNARKRYRPSMRQMIDDRALWRDAVHAARVEFDADGLSLPAMGDDPPVAFDDLLAPDPIPRAFADRLRAALPPASP
jgi:Domain of unknown function DUF29.